MEWIDSLKSATRFVQEFTRIYPEGHFILINDTSISYFVIDKDTQRIIINNKISNQSAFPQTLEYFAHQLQATNIYRGQPVTVLISGSSCFHNIDCLKDKRSGKLNKMPNGIDGESSIIKFRIFRYKKDARMVFYGGIRSDFYAMIENEFKKAGILIKDFVPLSFFILRLWQGQKISKPIAVKLPGQIIWLLPQDEKPMLLDVDDDSLLHEIRITEELISGRELITYLLNNEIRNRDTGEDQPLYSLFKIRPFEFKEQKAFFDDGLIADKKLRALIPISNALRLTSLIISGLCLLFIISAIGLRLWKTGYADILNTYQAEYKRKNELQENITELENGITKNNLANIRPTSFAGTISTFCQRRPRGLQLNEINILADKSGNWFATAVGAADQEDAIFTYKDYISEFSHGLPLEITWLKQDDVRYQHPGTTTNPKFNFRMKMNLVKR